MKPLGWCVLLVACWGCADKDQEDFVQTKPRAQSAADWPTGIKIHRNEKGAVVCPTDGSEIASAAKAMGHQDYKGVRYYFCCEGCPEAFKKDPEKYAEK